MIKITIPITNFKFGVVSVDFIVKYGLINLFSKNLKLCAIAKHRVFVIPSRRID